MSLVSCDHFEIVRDKIQLEEQAAKSEIIEVPTTVDGNNHIYKIGVIEIPTFYLDVEALHSNDPDFKSQTKEEFSTAKAKWGYKLDVSEAIIKKMCNKELMDSITNLVNYKNNITDAKKKET